MPQILFDGATIEIGEVPIERLVRFEVVQAFVVPALPETPFGFRSVVGAGTTPAPPPSPVLALAQSGLVPPLADLAPRVRILVGGNAPPTSARAQAGLVPTPTELPPRVAVLAGANAPPTSPLAQSGLVPPATDLPPKDAVLAGANAPPTSPLAQSGLVPPATELPPKDAVLAGANAPPVSAVQAVLVLFLDDAVPRLVARSIQVPSNAPPTPVVRPLLLPPSAELPPIDTSVVARFTPAPPPPPPPPPEPVIPRHVVAGPTGGTRRRRRPLGSRGPTRIPPELVVAVLARSPVRATVERRILSPGAVSFNRTQLMAAGVSSSSAWPWVALGAVAGVAATYLLMRKKKERRRS